MAFIGLLATSLWVGKLWARLIVLMFAGASGLWSGYWIVEITNAFFAEEALANAFLLIFPIFIVSAAIGVYLIKSNKVTKFFKESEV
jgi:hypothetical protein